MLCSTALEAGDCPFLLPPRPLRRRGIAAPHLLELVGVVSEERQEQSAQAVGVSGDEAGDAVVLGDVSDRLGGPELSLTHPLQVREHGRPDTACRTQTHSNV